MKLRAYLPFLFLIALLLPMATPAAASDIYDNGPSTLTSSAWTVNFGFVVSDSFLASGEPANGAEFIFWLIPGDTLSSIDLSIGTSPFGNDLANFTGLAPTQNSDLGINQYGYDIRRETFSFDYVYMNPGETYWITLQNASLPSGDPIYWDENSGPSLAQENAFGTIPSESFTIDGCFGCGCLAHPDCGPPMPEPESLLLLTSGGVVTLFGSGLIGMLGALWRKLF